MQVGYWLDSVCILGSGWILFAFLLQVGYFTHTDTLSAIFCSDFKTALRERFPRATSRYRSDFKTAFYVAIGFVIIMAIIGYTIYR